MVWPAAALALSVFLQREAQEAFCWHGEKSHLGALQKVYLFFKVAGLWLSAFNFNYLNRGKREVVLVWPALSHLKSVIQCWKHLSRIPFCLLLVSKEPESAVWISGPCWSFPWVAWGQWLQRALPALVASLTLADIPCANFRHSLVLPHCWLAAWCSVTVSHPWP